MRRALGALLATLCPRLAPSRALVARYDALVLALRGGELTALADIGPVARELRRRGVATPSETR